MFDKAIDCKAFLEDYFNVELKKCKYGKRKN